MNKFEEYKIKISWDNKKIVSNYLENIKLYIENNSLDSDLYNDIEERVFEKMSGYKDISQLDVKQILNEIGEPKDIFELEETSSRPQFMSFLSNVSFNVKNTFDKIFATWFSFNNLFSFIKVSFRSILKYTKKILLFSYNFTIKFIKKSISSVRKLSIFSSWLFLRILKIASNIIGYIILFISILWLFFIPLVYKWIEVWNINYTNIIPDNIIFSYILFIFSVFILWLFFIHRSKFLIYSILFWISWILSVSLWVLWWLDLYNNFSYLWKTQDSYILETDKKTLDISRYNINLYPDNYPDLDWFISSKIIDLKPSNNDKITVDIYTSILTKDKKSFEGIKNNLSTLLFSEEDWYLNIGIDWVNMFSTKTNFSPIYRKSTFFLPEGKTFRLSWYSRYRHFLDNSIANCESKTFRNIDWDIFCIQ